MHTGPNSLSSCYGGKKNFKKKRKLFLDFSKTKEFHMEEHSLTVGTFPLNIDLFWKGSLILGQM